MIDHHDYEEFTGLFDRTPDPLFTRYRLVFRATGVIMGGIPKDPEHLEGWLRRVLIPKEDQVNFEIRRVLADMEIEVPEGTPEEQIMELAKQVAGKQNGNTFRRRNGQLCLHAYNVKAMLKEATAVAYPFKFYASEAGEAIRKQAEKAKSDGKEYLSLKKNGKAYRSFLAETVFVEPTYLSLGVTEPDGVHVQVGRVIGPQGPRSTLTFYDYVVQPTIECVISSTRDMITQEEWETILRQGEKIGIGAVRSLSHGQFKILAFEQL